MAGVGLRVFVPQAARLQVARCCPIVSSCRTTSHVSSTPFRAHRRSTCARRCANRSITSGTNNHSMDMLNRTHKSVVNALEPLGVWMPTRSADVQVLQTPTQFYERLLQFTGTAQRRIVLSGLYLGTGPMEKALVTALEERCNRYPDLEVTVLIDHNRGTNARGGSDTSLSMLFPLLEKHSKARLLLVRPKASAVTWWEDVLAPFFGGRMREACSVYHAKFFVSDDAVLISGANMSDIYFTKRQDRNMVLQHQPRLARHLIDVADRLAESQLCTTVRKSSMDSCDSTNGQGVMDALALPQALSQSIGNASDTVLAERLRNAFTREPTSDDLRQQIHDSDTWIMPTIQFAGIGLRQDISVLSALLQWSASAMEGKDESDQWITRVEFATGYLSVAPTIMDLIQTTARLLSLQRNLSQQRHQGVVSVMAASEEANGWFGAKGYARHVPDLYASRLLSFLEGLRESKQDKAVAVRLYRRAGWTFHAKGLWVTQSPACETDRSEELSPVSIIGSSNFGFRSVHRDLELQCVIVTRSPDLARALSEEKQRFHEHCEDVDLRQAPSVGILPRLASVLVRSFM